MSEPNHFIEEQTNRAAIRSSCTHALRVESPMLQLSRLIAICFFQNLSHRMRSVKRPLGQWRSVNDRR